MPRIFLDFPFSRKVLWQQVTTGAFSVSLSVPIENLNFEVMIALPLTPGPYPTFKWVSGHGSTAGERATARGRADTLCGAMNSDSP